MLHDCKLTENAVIVRFNVNQNAILVYIHFKSSYLRYQLFLQLKQDILTGRLVPPHNTAIQMAALALQCEIVLSYVKELITTFSIFQPSLEILIH